MPLRLEIKRELVGRSERVKCVDLHPSEPWVAAGLYSGKVWIWNYDTETVVRTFDVSDVPVRCCAYVVRANWIVCGSDDMMIRVYNYNTHEKVKVFEAHSDYVRSLTVHPTLPLLITASDDMSIKSWNWEKHWKQETTFEGHTHYIMQVKVNPKDNSTFASASLDRTVKVWGVNTSTAHFELEGHERGVNCIAYYTGGDRPYLVSGADDCVVKVWDYQTKTCVATLEGHSKNISSVLFHPSLPIIVSGSEDGTVRIWHSSTYRLEDTLNYGMERVWSLSTLEGSNKVAIGYDEGTVIIKLGQEQPVASMDSSGKVVWAKNHDIQGANVRTASRNQAESIADGEPLSLATKDLSSCEVYPQSLCHNKNGRLLCVCGDGEYTVYTAISLKNKTFGHALEFAWGNSADVYATRESSSKIKLFSKFKERREFHPDFAATGVFGGHLLAVKSDSFVDFYDWDECRIIRRIRSAGDSDQPVSLRKMFWADSGDLCVIAYDDAFYVLRYNRELVAKFFEQKVEVDEEGIEDAFQVESEIPEVVTSGYFEGDCFIYVNSARRLNYCIGEQVMTLAHLDKDYWILGYLRKENRVYLIDKQYNIVTYKLLLAVLAYQTAIVREDFETAEEVLPQIPDTYHNKLARFLEAQDLREMALDVTKDVEHKFELALSGKKLELAYSLIPQSPSAQKWKQLADLALSEYNFALAEECAVKANDLGLLLLLYTSNGDRQGMNKLLAMAKKAGHYNIAFLCLFLTHRVKEAIDLLIEIGRTPEAAFMARTYLPSAVQYVTKAWQKDLTKVSARAAEAIADPEEHPSAFPTLPTAMKAEKWVADQNLSRANIPATSYPELKALFHQDLLSAATDGTLGDQPMISKHAVSGAFSSTQSVQQESKTEETSEYPTQATTSAASPDDTNPTAYPDLTPDTASPSSPATRSPSKSPSKSPSRSKQGTTSSADKSPPKAKESEKSPSPGLSSDDDLGDFENDSDLENIDTDELDEDLDIDFDDS